MAEGLYIHIPYCRGKCIYCDFYSTPRREGMEAVAGGIAAEIRARVTEAPRTVYIGGGTPSIMPPGLLAEIVGAIPAERVEEFTVEANPDDVDAAWAREMRALGVNRVSMGVQSLDDKVLRQIGRRHSAAQARRAVDVLLGEGIDNISCDLIYGLPGQSAEGWRIDLEAMLGWPIKHLSAYCLTWSEGTALHRMMLGGKLSPAGDADLAERYRVLCEMAAETGLEHYEISNFARPGYRSRHNSLYWERGGSWIGAGPAAHSYAGGERSYNPADIDGWLARLPMPGIMEEETATERVNDRIVSALRTAEGLDTTEIPAALRAGMIRDARRHIEAGTLVADGTRIAIPERYWFVSDSIMRDLIR